MALCNKILIQDFGHSTQKSGRFTLTSAFYTERWTQHASTVTELEVRIPAGHCYNSPEFSDPADERDTEYRKHCKSKTRNQEHAERKEKW
jgi:hypothetical protein